jgi:hypothetical protein
MRLAKVKGYPDLVKDLNSGAVINTNTAEINKARLLKEKRKADNDKLDFLAQEVRELKALLEKVLNNVKN